MQLLTRNITFLLLLLLVACGVRGTAEELWTSSQQHITNRQFDEAVTVLEKLVDAYPDHSLASQAQLLVGDIYMNAIGDLPAALAAFESTNDHYPETDEGVKALFMVGYVNANHLEDYDAAREAYTDFMNRYPNHELVQSVRFELEYLGMAVEDMEVFRDIGNQ